VALERLAPLGDEGGEPAPWQDGPAASWGATAERLSKPGKPKKPRYPSREEREQRAEAKAETRAAEIAADPTGFARQICLQLLEYGPRTRQELATALAKKGVPDAAADEVLGRFTEVGIIDDALFASLWVTSRHRGKGLAGRALSQELRRKGIDDELVREAVEQLDPDEEAQTARRLVRRKLPSTRGLSAEARVRRLAGMLARKGYGAGLAFRIVKEELEREGAEVPDLDTDGLAALE
jgi:SOS response regulatory protein OraA/RecX